MSFTLLLRTLHGWTNIQGDTRAEFETEEEAHAEMRRQQNAFIELDNPGTASEWKIVPTSDLGNYDLVA